MESAQLKSLKQLHKQIKEQEKYNNKSLNILKSYENTLTKNNAKLYIRRLQCERNRIKRVLKFLEQMYNSNNNNNNQRNLKKQKR